MAIQSYTFAYTAQTLSRRIRLRMFKTILAQDVYYFDDSKHSTGVLTSAISSKAQHISGACGLTLGTIIQSISTLLGGCIVGIAVSNAGCDQAAVAERDTQYSWRIALVGIALIPLTLASGLVDFYVIQLRDKHVKRKICLNQHEITADIVMTEQRSTNRPLRPPVRQPQPSALWPRSQEKRMLSTHTPWPWKHLSPALPRLRLLPMSVGAYHLGPRLTVPPAILRSRTGHAAFHRCPYVLVRQSPAGRRPSGSKRFLHRSGSSSLRIPTSWPGKYPEACNRER